MKLFNIKHRVKGYRLDEETALNIAGSLRYRWMKKSCFNALLCSVSAHYTHFSIIYILVSNTI